MNTVSPRAINNRTEARYKDFTFFTVKLLCHSGLRPQLSIKTISRNSNSGVLKSSQNQRKFNDFPYILGSNQDFNSKIYHITKETWLPFILGKSEPETTSEFVSHFMKITHLKITQNFKSIWMWTSPECEIRLSPRKIKGNQTISFISQKLLKILNSNFSIILRDILGLHLFAGSGNRMVYTDSWRVVIGICGRRPLWQTTTI